MDTRDSDHLCGRFGSGRAFDGAWSESEQGAALNREASLIGLKQVGSPRQRVELRSQRPIRGMALLDAATSNWWRDSKDGKTMMNHRRSPLGHTSGDQETSSPTRTRILGQTPFKKQPQVKKPARIAEETLSSDQRCIDGDLEQSPPGTEANGAATTDLNSEN